MVSAVGIGDGVFRSIRPRRCAMLAMPRMIKLAGRKAHALMRPDQRLRIISMKAGSMSPRHHLIRRQGSRMAAGNPNAQVKTVHRVAVVATTSPPLVGSNRGRLIQTLKAPLPVGQPRTRAPSRRRRRTDGHPETIMIGHACSRANRVRTSIWQRGACRWVASGQSGGPANRGSPSHSAIGHHPKVDVEEVSWSKPVGFIDRVCRSASNVTSSSTIATNAAG